VVIFSTLLRAFTSFALAPLTVFSLFLALIESAVPIYAIILAVSLLNIRHHWDLTSLSLEFPLLGIINLSAAVWLVLLADLSVEIFRLWCDILVLLVSAVMVFIQPNELR
jgi:hypothetical protein|tara:strand:- start:3629 stop:3958 length:330 start_codon:yes stop_codon:yes gene_type:complete